MNKYKHLSGFAKRKQKLEEEHKKKKLPKLTSFFSKTNNPPLQEPIQSISHISQTDILSNINNDLTTESNKEHAILMETDQQNKTHSQEQNQVSIQIHNLERTDKINFKEVLTDNDKKYIVKYGPCQPLGIFPKNAEGRSFNSSYYIQKSKSGITYRRNWLCYSIGLNMAYCEPCWIFGKREIHNIKDAWINGYNDWRHISQSISRHESSNNHVVACQIYKKWKLDKNIDMDLDKELKFKMTYWENVLHRIINVTLTLAQNNLAFRGHKESFDVQSGNSGNFLNIIKLLSIYDPILKELLSKDKGTVKYLSPVIQNELIDILAKEVKTELVNKINKSPFLSIIIDTTQDISKIDQISFTIRFVELITDDNDAKTSDLMIREFFLGFKEADGQTAEDLEAQLLNYFEDNTLDIMKLRAQGYDGAANMSGIYNGLQAKILRRQLNAVYVHCAAHNLNLVINDAVKSSKDIRNFYDLLESVYVYFGHSISRWATIISMFENKKHSLKRLCPTRWSSRYDTLHSLRFHYAEILRALTKISLTSKKTMEQNEAQELKKKLEKFETVILVVLESKILSITNIVSNALQNKNIDIGRASTLLKSAYEQMIFLRNNFNIIIDDATLLANTWGINPTFEKKRISKVKKQFDELSHDERLANPESNFKTTVFYSTIDVIIAQLKRRFEGLNNIVENFKPIFPSTLENYSDDELVKFPKEVSIRAQWLHACKLSDKDNVIHIHICSDHFVPSDYKNSIGLCSRKWLLKPGAVPSVNVPNPPAAELQFQSSEIIMDETRKIENIQIFFIEGSKY
ncbi:zinc finger MYM-type protein 1-like [Solenopsis invicta]|uniref:zinc finger MYM-type protein 1-like n=1 Tax=Solenopsis invicta TaxID=13686 RepID=UPI00193D8DF8|nr:zinc finger MYM-type protein 1-like [Solenopsis invicta]